jgi:hypothetical protein
MRETRALSSLSPEAQAVAAAWQVYDEAQPGAARDEAARLLDAAVRALCDKRRV